MYENPIHLLINVDIFFIHYVFQISKKTNILKIAITIKVLGTLEYLFIVMQGSRGGGAKIQWGPYEILPEGPMDPPKLENW